MLPGPEQRLLPTSKAGRRRSFCVERSTVGLYTLERAIMLQDTLFPPNSRLGYDSLTSRR
jgi:hypothetical protein